MDQATSNFIIGVSGAVLSLVMTILCFLLWNVIKTMRQDTKENSLILVQHGQMLASHEERHDGHDEKFQNMTNRDQVLADQVVQKIKVALALREL